jgi:hypothetical protein
MRGDIVGDFGALSFLLYALQWHPPSSSRLAGGRSGNTDSKQEAMEAIEGS